MLWPHCRGSRVKPSDREVDLQPAHSMQPPVNATCGETKRVEARRVDSIRVKLLRTTCILDCFGAQASVRTYEILKNADSPFY